MRLQDYFKNVFSYAAGMEEWVCKALFQEKMTYTFVQDFAIADWYGEKDVKETYERVKKEWLSDYKAFTEVVVSLNMLAWAHDQLRKQGIDGRDDVITLYNTMYYQSKDDFYDKYTGNEEACHYFFIKTD